MKKLLSFIFGVIIISNSAQAQTVYGLPFVGKIEKDVINHQLRVGLTYNCNCDINHPDPGTIINITQIPKIPIAGGDTVLGEFVTQTDSFPVYATPSYFFFNVGKDSLYQFSVQAINDSGSTWTKFYFYASAAALAINTLDEKNFSIQNPIGATCTITSETPLTKAVITDLMGRTIHEEEWSKTAPQSYVISTGALPTGIYLVSLFDNGNRLVTKRILKE